MFIVSYRHADGTKYYLRSTIWTADIARAVRFPSHAEATDALAKRHRVIRSMGAKLRDIKTEQQIARVEQE